MIIYADILFLLNAFITYIALLLSAILLKLPVRRLRILIASLIGGIYALSILIEIPFYFSFVLKCLVCASMILVSFGKSNFRHFLIHVLVFLVINVLIGGIVLLLSFADKNRFYSNVYISYMDISPLTLIIALTISFIIVSIINRILTKKRQKEEIYKVIIHFAQQRYILFGFCDSGNNLNEPFSALPVCIVKKGIIKGFSEYSLKRIIPYSSLGGEGMMQAIKMPLTIQQTGKNEFDAVAYIAESTNAFQDMPYDIILHPHLFKETEIL